MPSKFIVFLFGFILTGSVFASSPIEDYNASKTYSTGALVLEGQNSYIMSGSGTSLGQAPASNPSVWTDLSVAATALQVPTETVPTLSTDTILNSLPGSAPSDGNSSSTTVSLSNLSTRGFVGTGASQMIAGFIVSGTGSTTITIRALGPTLAGLGVSGALADPILQIYDGSGNLVTSNDNFADHSSASAVSSSGKANINSLESAVQIVVTPGSYTAVVSGSGGATGNALVEVYNENTSSTTITLSNLSTRGFVGTGASQMIAGFIVSSNTTVTIRALGPTLTGLGVSGALANPVLQIYDAGGNLVTSNDNFADHSSASAVTSSGKANINSLEAALQIAVTPGSYTAVVSGSGGATGNALVEVYDESN